MNSVTQVVHWHSLTEKDIFRRLKTKRSGLSVEEAGNRLKEYGSNTLPEKARYGPLKFLFSQLESPFTVILLAAAGITFWLGDIPDSIVILIALIANVLFGFFQEWKSERTLEALKAIVRYEAPVIREGSLVMIAADNVVPGDIMVLRAGERVLADVRIIEAEMLEISEAVLTGETSPAKKIVEFLPEGTPVPDRLNMAFAGTIVNRGTGLTVVVATGISTQVGGIAQSLVEVEEGLTPLQKRLKKLANFVTVGIIALALTVFVAGFLARIPLVEIFTTAIALAIAAIPAELVVAVSVILTIGMRRLLERKALIRKLVAAETLGSVTALCVDKTGTLTEGQMRVVEIIVEGGDETRNLLLRAGIFCNEADIEPGGKILGETTDVAIMHAAREAGLSKVIALRKDRILDILPFESINRYMAAIVIEEHGPTLYVKGAAEKVVTSATTFMHKDRVMPFLESDKERLMGRHDELSAQGFRLIALGFRHFPSKGGPLHLGDVNDHLKDLTFIGFAVIEDPLRANVKDSLHEMEKAGVNVSILTGDHVLTAQTIGTKLGVFEKGERVLNGEELEKMSDEEFSKVARDIAIYARVLPHQKLRIVSALQAQGEVVAMTGDGINDAPALKKSDIGIAVGGAADVAKEASDIVLLDSNFDTIVAAIKEGRIIFDNIRKATIFLFTDSLGEIVLVGGYLILSLLGFLPQNMLPLLAAQILWINLAEDSLPNFALAFEKEEQNVMDRPPTPIKSSILSKEVLALIVVVSVAVNLMLLGIFVWLIREGISIDYARTLVFAASGIDSLFFILCIRNLSVPIWRSKPWENPWIPTAILAGLGLMLAAIYVPSLQELLHTKALSLVHWIIIAFYITFGVLLFEALKIFMGLLNKWRVDKIKIKTPKPDNTVEVTAI
ncbi:MAG: ATPase, P-type (Transporting), HAD superfamily, subfamily IC [Parcubacteria group bacterium GW2011_GWB1_40_14]|nr:MAG: ATPase, P-type (Transporting), HAD superfamily, subfamily IC [Parcubacteria group bacterium GW2011_GWB1_40_14]